MPAERFHREPPQVGSLRHTAADLGTHFRLRGSQGRPSRRARHRGANRACCQGPTRCSSACSSEARSRLLFTAPGTRKRTFGRGALREALAAHSAGGAARQQCAAPCQRSRCWLLHSRRVPVTTDGAAQAASIAGASGASQIAGAACASRSADSRPPCAGIGDEQGLVFTCWEETEDAPLMLAPTISGSDVSGRTSGKRPKERRCSPLWADAVGSKYASADAATLPHRKRPS